MFFFGTLHSNGYIFPFSFAFWLLFFSQLFVRPPQTAILLYKIANAGVSSVLIPPEITNPSSCMPFLSSLTLSFLLYLITRHLLGGSTDSQNVKIKPLSTELSSLLKWGIGRAPGRLIKVLTQYICPDSPTWSIWILPGGFCNVSLGSPPSSWSC